MRKIIVLGALVVLCLTLMACSTKTGSETNPSLDYKVKIAGAATNDMVGTSEYPSRPVNLVIPYKAGGTADFYGRAFGSLLEKYLGQSIIINNMSGFSGIIGTEEVNAQPSDGYTLLLSAETLGSYKVMGTSDLGYDDFTAVSPLIEEPKIIVVSKDSKYNTLNDLLDDIEANPNKITMSHSGAGSSGYNQGLVLRELGFEVSMESFDSGSEALLGVINSQVDFTNANLSTMRSYMKSGEVKALGVFSNERMDAYPDIAAFTEVIPEAEDFLNIPYTILSIMVNNDTPPQIVQALKDMTKKVFDDPEWTKLVEDNNAVKLYDKYKDPESINQLYDDYESIIGWLQYDNGIAPNSPESFGIPRILGD